MRELIETYITADSDMTKMACTFMLEKHGWMFDGGSSQTKKQKSDLQNREVLV